MDSEADAPWRADAAARIEQHRKSELTGQVTEYDIRLVPATNDPKADYQAKWRRPMPQPPTPEMEQLEADYLRDEVTMRHAGRSRQQTFALPPGGTNVVVTLD